MQQYYYDGDLANIIQGDKVLYNYLIRTLKSDVGQKIILFNGDAKAEYSIEKITKDSLDLYKLKNINFKRKKYSLNLAVGLLKKDKLEWLIQKACEIGIDNLYLLNLENNVVQFNENKARKKLKRYNEIIKSAVMQSKGNFITNVYYLANFKNMLEKRYDKILLAHEKIRNQKKTSLVKELKNVENNYNILICIGPEGGFSKKEIDFLKGKNVKLISLGDNILKSETAGIYALSITKAMMEELDEKSSV